MIVFFNTAAGIESPQTHHDMDGIFFVSQFAFGSGRVKEAVDMTTPMVGVHAVGVRFQFLDIYDKSFSVICHFLFPFFYFFIFYTDIR
jgi:hypothetical protein